MSSEEGRRRSFLSLFKKGENAKRVYQEQALAELGINLLVGYRLDSRLDTISEFLEKLRSDEVDPFTRVDMMRNIVEEAIIPYLEGRDNPNALRLIDAWGKILGFFKQITRFPDLNEKYHDIIDSISRNEIYQAFLIMLTVAFSREDLAKNIVAVIQTYENVIPQAVPLTQSRITRGGKT